MPLGTHCTRQDPRVKDGPSTVQSRYERNHVDCEESLVRVLSHETDVAVSYHHASSVSAHDQKCCAVR